jgi:uncharacterized protein DUF6263
MKKLGFLIIASAILITCGYSQKVAGKLNFKKGDKIEVSSITKSVISQEAMGQNIEFNVERNITEIYEILDVNADQSKVNHTIKRIALIIDGMGQTQSFDSDKKDTVEGKAVSPLQDALVKKYEATINRQGTITGVKNITEESSKPAEANADMIVNLLKMLGPTIQLPTQPVQGEASLFKIMPAKELGKNESWTDSTVNAEGKEITTYTLKDITATEILIDYTTQSSTSVKGEMMGMETTTNLNNKTKGTITIDKTSGIIKQKIGNTESNGTVEMMGQSIPLTAKSTTTINVKF